MKIRAYILSLLIAVPISVSILAQPPAQRNDQRKVVDLKGKFMSPIDVGDSTAIVLSGGVIAYHNGAVITCDSAVRYSSKRIDCFGNVIINKDSTYVYGEKADYNGDSNTARVYSQLIKMIDGDAVLYTYNFEYNTLSNVGRYYGGGTMSQNETLVESERGYYYSDTKDLVAVGKAELRDTTYQIRSDSLGYNMDTEVASFYMKTFIWNDKGEILSANSGSYDTRNDVYNFKSNAYVLTESQEIWADDIVYYASLEDVIMRRNVQIREEDNEILAFGDYGRYWGASGNAVLTENPSLISFNLEQGDSVYMRSDSMLLYVIDSTSIYHPDYKKNKSAVPIAEEEIVAADDKLVAGVAEDNKATEANAENNQPEVAELQGQQPEAQVVEAAADGSDEVQSVAQLSKKELKKLQRKQRREERKQKRAARKAKRTKEYETRKGIVQDSLKVADTLKVVAEEEIVLASKEKTDSDRVFIAHRNVKIYREDFQVKCDSLLGFTADSTIRMYLNPVMWSGESQIKADEVQVQTANQAILKAVFTGGPPIMSERLDRYHYNQVTGKVIEAHFADNDIYRTDAVGNAQTYYYMQEDDTRAYQGFMAIEAADISFYIDERTLTKITYRTNPVYAIYPMDQIPASQEQLFPNFVWEGHLKPVKEDVFNRTIRPSQREEYKAIKTPLFPLTDKIKKKKASLIKSGKWADRTEKISDDAQSFINNIESSRQL